MIDHHRCRQTTQLIGSAFFVFKWLFFNNTAYLTAQPLCIQWLTYFITRFIYIILLCFVFVCNVTSSSWEYSTFLPDLN